RLSPPLASTLFPYTTLFRSVVPQVNIGRMRVTSAAIFGKFGNFRADFPINPFSPSLHRKQRTNAARQGPPLLPAVPRRAAGLSGDRKSTRLNFSHLGISYAV